MIKRIALALTLAASVAGCQGNKEQPLHGTSTRRASVAPETPFAPAPAQAPTIATYGEPLKLAASDTVPVATVMHQPGDYEGKYVRVAGTVTKVCPRKGCWLELADASGASKDTLFVKFEDPASGRLIPMEAVDKNVVVEGTVKLREIPESHARHLKEEAGAPTEELAKIVGPQKQLMLTDPRAQIAGVTK
jgi:hypothetical protein